MRKRKQVFHGMPSLFALHHHLYKMEREDITKEKTQGNFEQSFDKSLIQVNEEDLHPASLTQDVLRKHHMKWVMGLDEHGNPIPSIWNAVDLCGYLKSYVADLNEAIFAKHMRSGKGDVPDIALEGPCVRLHWNMVNIYQDRDMSDIVEMATMTATSTAGKRLMEDWRTGACIISKFGHDFKPRKIVKVKFLFDAPEPMDDPREHVKYWKHMQGDAKKLFGDRSGLTEAEQLYFIRKGWEHEEVYRQDMGGHCFDMMRWMQVRYKGTYGDDLREEMLKLRQSARDGSLSAHIISSLARMDFVCERVFDMSLGLPFRQALLPLIFEWARIRIELKKEMDAFQEMLDGYERMREMAEQSEQ